MAESSWQINLFSCPYDQIYFFTNFQYWSSHLDFHYCMLTYALGVLSDLYNVNLFAGRSLAKLVLYVGRPSSLGRVEFGFILIVPTPIIVSYNSNSVIYYIPSAGAVWPVSAHKFDILMLGLSRFWFPCTCPAGLWLAQFC